MGVFLNFIFEFIFEILIVLSVYFFVNPIKSIGIFIILTGINIIKSSYSDTLSNMITFVDFKTLKFRSRFEYILSRVIARILNPISFIFMCVFTYSLYKEFGFLYSWLEQPIIFLILFYVVLIIIIFILEIFVNFYIYETLDSKHCDSFVLHLEFFYFLLFAIGAALSIKGINFNKGIIQLIFAILIIGKCLYDKNWKLTNYILYTLFAKMLMFVLVIFMYGIILLACSFTKVDINETIFISTILSGFVCSFIYAKFSALLYKKYKNN